MEENEPKQGRVRDLFVWTSPSRPAINYPKGTFLTLGSLVVLITTILVFFQEWLAIAVAWAAYFAFYMLTKVPQTAVEHKITTEGIISLDKTYLWGDLGPFWFTTTHNQETILHVAHPKLFGYLSILLDPSDREKIRDSLAAYLPFIEKVEKSAVEKISDWFSQKILHA